jgi:hypothetical protein
MTAMPANAVVRPPRSWDIKTLILLAAIGCAALITMINLAADLVVREYLLSDGRSGMSPLVSAVVDNADGVELASLLLVMTYIGAYLWWNKQTRNLLRAAGDPDGTAARHLAIKMWNLAVVAAVAIQLCTPRSTPRSTQDLANRLGWDAVQLGAWLVGLAVLMIGVWQIRAQVTRRVAQGAVALRIDTASRDRSAVAAARAANPAADGLPRADDEFWQQVERLAAEAGTDLALLETTDSVVRRWVLVPGTGDLAAVRAALAVGAIITVFAEPPAAADGTDFTPAPADDYFGLVEHSTTGALWFQAVTPDRVPAFLGLARTARRWALYPANSPTALTAVVESRDLQTT